jgi:uncharacterized protein YprB with RNaseH-like and TPR domain
MDIDEIEHITFKAAVFDIEVTDFTAGGSMDFLICTSVLPLDSDQPITYRLEWRDKRNDKKLLKRTVAALEEYDILIGHNIAAFDFNWLNSRIMYHGLPEIKKPWLYYDTYQAAKRMAIKARRKSLGFLCDFFRLNGENEKTSVLPVSWGMVNSPVKAEFEEAMTDIVYHCEQDVILNRRLFDVLWPRDRQVKNLPKVKKW